MKTHFLNAAKGMPIENCLTVEQLNDRIDVMESGMDHDQLPGLYDRLVAVRNELEGR